MKKNKIRLTLNRETLRNLGADEVRNAGGGASGQPICYQSLVTCSPAACLTQTCPTNCGQWYCYGV